MSIPNIWKTTEKIGIYIDLTSCLLDHRMIFIRGVLTADLASLATTQLFALSQSNEPISLYINCCGGSILDGLAVVVILTNRLDSKIISPDQLMHYLMKQEFFSDIEALKLGIVDELYA